MMSEATSEALKKAQERRKGLYDRGELEILSPVDRAATKPKSRPAAIKGMCWECVGRGNEPGAKKEIGQCSCYDCPLWHIRPYQNHAPAGFGENARREALAKLKTHHPKHPTISAVNDPTSKAQAIWAKCYDCMGGESQPIHLTRHLIANCASVFPTGQKKGYRGCPLHQLRKWTTDSKSSAVHGDVSNV